VDSGTGTENQLLDDINQSFSVGSRRCPGFPDGFASLAAVRGPGIGTFSSSGEGTEPILNPDGGQAYTDAGVPRFLQTRGIGLTACVYTTPYPPVVRRATANARPTQTGSACVANVGPNENVSVADPGTIVQGTGGADRLAATPGADLMIPGAGDDVVVGGPGPLDVVDPSPGNDRIFGGAGADHLSGGPGDDLIDAGPGPFWSDGGPGNDRIIQRGSEGAIWGGPGDDVIRTHSVRGNISGGPGQDLFKVSGGTKGVVFDGGAGDDRYDIAAGPGCAAIFERDGGGRDEVRTGRCLREVPHVEVITMTGAAPLRLRTSRGDQVLTGNDGDNVLDGGAGRDTMDGGAGDDVLHLGGDAYDTATGGPGADRFVPGGTPSSGYHTQLAPNARSHRITDFSAASGDRIVLRAAAFGPEVRRLRQDWTLVSAVAPRAREPKPTILHDPGSGLIAFDRDGSGIRSPRVVAMVPRGTPVGPTMFEVR
jgi:Ca2+-binding RTX toxin-like protein